MIRFRALWIFGLLLAAAFVVGTAACDTVADDVAAPLSQGGAHSGVTDHPSAPSVTTLTWPGQPPAKRLTKPFRERSLPELVFEEPPVVNPNPPPAELADEAP